MRKRETREVYPWSTDDRTNQLTQIFEPILSGMKFLYGPQQHGCLPLALGLLHHQGSFTWGETSEGDGEKKEKMAIFGGN